MIRFFLEIDSIKRISTTYSSVALSWIPFDMTLAYLTQTHLDTRPDMHVSLTSQETKYHILTTTLFITVQECLAAACSGEPGLVWAW